VKKIIQHYPIGSYFFAVFALSFGSFAIVVVPKLVRGQSMQAQQALFMFPVLVVGVGLSGMLLARLVDGRSGLRDLTARMRRWRVGRCWYAAVLIPPVFVLSTLLAFRFIVSPSFTPNSFYIGALFGIFPGFFEELGWMGYVFPKMKLKRSPFAAALLLGVLWGIWHLPVVDFLGASAPHGHFLPVFFCAFVAVLTAMRILIAWVYGHTQSVLLAQLMHASSTGALVVFSPAHVTPAQEAMWYAVYAAALWGMVVLVLAKRRSWGFRLG
jgi:membrane protease YdiL (CAAX protease family)